MKRTCALLLAVTWLVLSSQAASAQLLTGKGVKAGLSIAKLAVSHQFVESSDFKTGFCGGFYVSLGLLPQVEIQPQLLYAERGGKYKVTSTDEQGNPIDSDDLVYKFNYLSFPVLARISLPIESRYVPAVITGPALDIRLSAKEYLPRDQVLQDSGDREQDADWVKSMDVSWIVGAGLDVELTSTNLLIEALYSFGLSDINDADFEGASKIHNRSFMLMAGFGF
jgi:hypothetical protein